MDSPASDWMSKRGSYSFTRSMPILYAGRLICAAKAQAIYRHAKANFSMSSHTATCACNMQNEQSSTVHLKSKVCRVFRGDRRGESGVLRDFEQLWGSDISR